MQDEESFRQISEDLKDLLPLLGATDCDGPSDDFILGKRKRDDICIEIPKYYFLSENFLTEFSVKKKKKLKR